MHESDKRHTQYTASFLNIAANGGTGNAGFQNGGNLGGSCNDVAKETREVRVMSQKKKTWEEVNETDLALRWHMNERRWVCSVRFVFYRVECSRRLWVTHTRIHTLTEAASARARAEFLMASRCIGEE